jgi:hypothetical protein
MPTTDELLNEPAPSRGRARRRPAQEYRCAHCGDLFQRFPSSVKSKTPCCSRECAFALKRGSSDWSNWKNSALPEILSAAEKYGPPGGQMRDKKYLVCHWPEHPIANSKNGRVYVHRAVAYEHVGEGIQGNHVDHINNDGLDNRWENLRVLTPSAHARKTAAFDRAPAGLWEWVQSQPDILARWEAVTLD